MPLFSKIRDGEGTGRLAGVTPDSALKVAIVEQAANTIPIAQLIRQKQLKEFLVNGGSRELNVDGSVSTVDFTVASAEGITKWVTRLRVLLNGVNFELDTNDFRRFGAAAIAPGLTNGVEFFTVQEGITTNLVPDPIQTAGDFMDSADRFVNFINAISAQSDFLSFDFDFAVPVVLPAGAADTIVCRVRDDLTALDLFQVLVIGYQEVQAA